MQRKNFVVPLADATGELKPWIERSLAPFVELSADETLIEERIVGRYVILVKMPTNARALRSFVKTANRLRIMTRECRPDAVPVVPSWETLSPVDFVDEPGKGKSPTGTRAILTRPSVDASPWREAIGTAANLLALVQSPYVVDAAYLDTTAHSPDARGSGQTKKADSHSHRKHK